MLDEDFSRESINKGPDRSDYRIGKLVTIAIFCGLFGIGASVTAAYFLSGGNRADISEKFYAAVGGSPQRDAPLQQAILGTILPFQPPQLKERQDAQKLQDALPATRAQSALPAITPQPSAPQLVTSFGKILISEAQIAGAAAGDEFIEFFNPNDFVVSLDGWSVTKKTSGGKESSLISARVFKSATIAPQSYLLAARTEAEIPARPNLWWAKSNTISANDTLILYGKFNDETVIVDALGFGNAFQFEGNPAPNPGAGETLARKNITDAENNAADFIISTPSPRNAASGQGFSSPPAAPSPLPSPTPNPSPTPLTSPNPSPSPAPLPSPTPSPTPTPSPSAVSTPTPSPSPAQTGRCAPEQIDINTAAKKDLERIKHIGSVRADELITLRPFVSVDDMKRIKGIGETRLADIKAQNLACVN